MTGNANVGGGAEIESAGTADTPEGVTLDVPDVLSDLLPRFGIASFRPGQDQVVTAVHQGRDVMCVMPTGGGKSLCYQLPSLARSGVTIVVSPLIALMKDQVDALRRRDISAAMLNSTLSAAEQSALIDRMVAGDLSMVYVAPERMRHNQFLDAIGRCNVSLLAVDEAHCVSDWGHDFRPDYARLGHFRKRYLNDVQTIALTATATPTVREDIVKLLALEDPATFVTGFRRTNLHLSVTESKTLREKQDALVAFLDSREGCGIIYAATRKRCEEIAEWLPERIGRPAVVYHAGLDSNVRRRVQEAFMAGDFPIIIATNAFGMGIDKSDIRFVVHFNLPGTLEAYYQEAGRAGRDGLDSDCRLLFSYDDRYVQEFFIDNKYPTRETVQKVHTFLLSRQEDPIELTLDEVREAIDVKDSSESIGTAETLLARAGVLRRLDSSSNQMMVRLDTKTADVIEMLPREAKLRRKVLAAVDRVIGRRRGEDVYVTPRRLLDLSGVDRPRLTRTLRELCALRCFDYVPPFRGRGVHVRDRVTPFDKLDIDFDELQRRKDLDLKKLESVIGFARSGRCRQTVILDYFGEADAIPCGACDRCDDQTDGGPVTGGVPESIVPDGVDPAMLLRGFQIVLSGVTRTHGRFGRTLVAQMLCGSTNKRLKGLKLDRLSTYGLLASMRQNEIVEVIDALTTAGLCEQVEVEQRRPTIQISSLGRRVMLTKESVPASVKLSYPIAKKLARAASQHDAGDVQSESAGTGPSSDTGGTGGAATPAHDDPVTETLKQKLKRFRQRTSAAHALPAYRVLSNAVIDRLATERPRTTEQLAVVNGVGDATIESYGYDIVEIITTVLTDEGVNGDINEGESPGYPADASPERQSNRVKERETPRFRAKPQTHNSQPHKSQAHTPQAQTGAEAVLPSEPNVKSGSKFEPDNWAGDFEALIDAGETAADIDGQTAAAFADRVEVPDSDDRSPAYWTWRLFRDGYAADEVMEARKLDADGVLKHLADAADEQLAVQTSWLRHPALGDDATARFERL